MTSQDFSFPPAGLAHEILWQRFSRNRAAVLGLVLFAAVVLVALLADVITPATPYAAPATRWSGLSSMRQRRSAPTSLAATFSPVFSMARVFP